MLKIATVVLFSLGIGVAFSFNTVPASGQATPDLLKNDSCVACHSQVSLPADLATKYFEWHVSAHAAANVGCEKCHGGDSTAKDAKQAHRGVLPRSDSQSRLSDSNVTATCAACHQAIARSFVESTHYNRLMSSGMGPSCTSCHSHMASSVVRSGSRGEALCTYCHNTVEGLLPPRPDIPANSKATLDAIQRTEYVLTQIKDLLMKEQARHISVDAERNGASGVKASIEGSKIAWHTFNVDGVRQMADKSYIQAVEIRDRLSKRLGD